VDEVVKSFFFGGAGGSNPDGSMFARWFIFRFTLHTDPMAATSLRLKAMFTWGYAILSFDLSTCVKIGVSNAMFEGKR
jgi:hypothetical protein